MNLLVYFYLFFDAFISSNKNFYCRIHYNNYFKGNQDIF